MKKLPINRVICGNAIEILRTFPADTIDTIVTSPPYWGLRDYGDQTRIVWGGDLKCKHKFKLEKKRDPNYRGGHGQFDKKGIAANMDVNRIRKEGFCQRCGAWYGQLGLEPTLELFIEHILQIAAELKRVLKPTGVMFWNHGDNYSTGLGSHGRRTTYDNISSSKEINWVPDKNKPPQPQNYPAKCLMLQNYRLILRMIDEQGWVLRNSIIWHKPNAMPSSVKDRLTTCYELVFFLTKANRYYFDLDAIRKPHKTASIQRAKYLMNPYGDQGTGSKARMTGSLKSGGKRKMIELPKGGKNPGDVWTISTRGFPEAHFATFPAKLIEPMIKSSCPAEICVKCGKARERLIENLNKGKHKGIGATSGEYLKRRQKGERKGDNTVKYAGKTIGWTKCDCKNPEYKAGIVLDPFMGAGTTALVAQSLGRNWIGIELNPEYIKIIKRRLAQQPLF